VRAEVTATGFQATLPLYAGDSMDSSFDVRFAEPVWVSDDVIRWPSRSPAPLKSLNSVISVENRSNVTFPSIRVWYEDLIVLVRVASGADVSIPTSDWWGSEYPRVDIAAFDAGGRPLATASTDADLRAWRGPSASIRVVLSGPDQISVSISPRQP
jgi:hypothetical protein